MYIYVYLTTNPRYFSIFCRSLNGRFWAYNNEAEAILCSRYWDHEESGKNGFKPIRALACSDSMIVDLNKISH